MKEFIKLEELGREFLVRKSAIISVSEHPDSDQTALVIDFGNKTDVYLADNSLEDIFTKLGGE